MSEIVSLYFQKLYEHIVTIAEFSLNLVFSLSLYLTISLLSLTHSLTHSLTYLLSLSLSHSASDYRLLVAQTLAKQDEREFRFRRGNRDDEMEIDTEARGRDRDVSIFATMHSHRN
jgi:hypothetical protein